MQYITAGTCSQSDLNIFQPTVGDAIVEDAIRYHKERAKERGSLLLNIDFLEMLLTFIIINANRT